MSETIFLLDNNGNLTELNEANYISEDLLQKLLADYPKLISGSQINFENPRRWLLIDREVGIPDQITAGNRWSLDHLFIDQDGIPTLVEVKRSTDTRIRREVVGQILDYAANAVSYWTIEEIIHRLKEQCNAKLQDYNLVLDEFLAGSSDADNFWELVKTNLKAGKIRMLVVADTIPKELQRIIEFLNEQMNPAEILGIEIKQFAGGDNYKTLVPRVIGQTANAENIKASTKTKGEHWNKGLFFEAINNLEATERDVILKLYDWVNPLVSRIWYGTGRIGSFVPVLNHKKTDNQLFCVLTSGNIELYFQWYKGKAPFDNEEKRLELFNRLNKIKGLNLPIDKLNKRPNFSVKLLANPESFAMFISTFEWFINEIKTV